ncbi:LOW QUALITY PROTEIN: filamin-A-like [Babylonia areolata]|uniref:LOW QUALITY PROTEIN: filamin-A-like n=1 Tax=Babylonia areolata TaxID=304850 RepID=UPI003FD28C55
MQGEEFDEEEALQSERELADDAQWKIIQKNTFTRWANEHLKTVNKSINDLEGDFSDGLRLIALIEVLSSKKFKHINKRPNFRTQKLENVTMTLKFLEEDEGIRIVNIDSTDIVDKKLKLILGLIWTLILHYSISMPMWEGEEPTPSEGAPTPKQRLLNWINSKLPDLPVKNFTTDWNDGRAIGALVDAIGPGLCPDWEDWDPKKAKDNAKEAMDAAEKYLGVPQLIKPDEMTNPKVDDLSMMTYLSQFPNAKLKPGAPVRPKINAARVRAYGPGLEPKGNQVGAPARFTVETFSAGKGTVEVTILNPKGAKEKCEVVFNNDKNQTYSCVYVPTMEGQYRVIVKFAAKEVPKSPFTVNVEGAAGDASKVTAKGPGIEKTGVVATKKTYFEVYTKGAIKIYGAGKGQVDVVILDPQGRKDTVRPSIQPVVGKEGTYLVEYTAIVSGTHTVTVLFAGNQIPKSPFTVQVSAPSNAKACYATGRGIQPRGIRVKENAVFYVHTEGAGEGDVDVKIIGPGGIELKCQVRKMPDQPRVYECIYVPTKPGNYIINVSFADEAISKSPFKVEVGPIWISKIVAYGPGLEGGVVNQPANFTVETNGEVGALGFSIEGPSEAKIDCKDNGDGSADVTYWPTVPGEYAVHVLCNEKDIPNSPYMAQIRPATTEFNAGKVIAKGPGLQKTGVVVSKWAEFTVDTKLAGKAPLNITCMDVDYKPVEVQVKDNRDGTYSCRYMPTRPVKYTVTITYGGVAIPNSPFRVYVSEPSSPAKVKVYGPGISPGVKTNTKTYFVIDCKQAGPGDVAVGLTDERGMDVPVKTIDNKDGTFRVEYEPKTPGVYTVMVYFAGAEVPQSPIKVTVESSMDTSGIKVEGIEPKIPVGVQKTATIRIPPKLPKAAVKMTITSPTGKTTTVPVNDMMDRKVAPFTLQEPGPHTIEITYGGAPVKDSPFKVEAFVDTTPKVKAYGPGLTGGEAMKPAVFTIDAREETRPGNLGVTVEGPKESKIDVKDNGDGTCGVTYLPEVPGDYKVNVTHGDRPIKGSPFTAKIKPAVEEVPKVKAYGPGLTGGEAMKPASFTIDARRRPNPGNLGVTVEGPKESKIDFKDNGDGTCGVTYMPEVPGDYKVNVTHADRPIKGSPFTAKIKPAVEEPKVKAYGPGLTGGEAMKPATFTIDAREETKPGGLGVTVEGPKESKIDFKDNGDGTCGVTYMPEVPGDYKVNVTHADRPIKGSPFTAKIKPSTGAPVGDEPRVKAYGPGLTGGEALKPAQFTIDTREETRPGGLGVTVEGPKESKIDCMDNGDGTCSVSYLPEVPGEYKVNVTHADKPIPGSPFTAKIQPSSAVDLSGVTAYGPGLSPDGVFMEAPTEFTVDAHTVTPTGEGQVQAILTTPTGRKVATKVSNNKDGTYPVLYTPMEQGPQALDVTYDGNPIPGSPFKVNAVPGNDPNRVRAYGPGLEGGVTNKPNKFTVDMKGAGKGALGLGIQGPTEAKMKCKDNHDGTCEVEYFPDQPGNYDISVNFAGKPIPDSPFRVRVSSEVDASKVKCYGPGVDSKGVTAGAPATFTVDTKEAGDAPLQVTYTDQTGATRPANVVPVEEGVFQASYVPAEEGKCKVDVQYGGTEVPNSPFQMRVLPGVDVSKVKVTGPGVEGTTPASLPVVFTVDPRETEPAPLECFVQRPDGTFIRPAVKDNLDGTFDVVYTPEDLGVYNVVVKYAGQDVPGVPFPVKATPIGDASKCKITEGADKMVPVNKETVITVDAAEAGNGKVTCRIRQPNGSEIDIDIIDKGDGTFSISFTPQFPGDYTIEIKFGGNLVPEGDYTIHAVSEEVYEDYLVQGPVGATEDMITADTVDSLRAGAPGAAPYQTVDFRFQVGPVFNYVSAMVVTPSGKTDYPKIVDNGDGTVTVRYQPTETGLHELHVMYNNENIEGSPFMFHVEAVNTGNVTAYGPGLSTGVVDEPAYFTINTRQAGPGGLSLAVEGPSRTDIKCVDNQDGTCTVSYVPTMPGEYAITAKFADKDIMGSPFTAKILPRTGEPRKRAQLSVGTSSEVSLKVTETDISDLTATVRSPSGHEEPCLLKRLANGHLGMTFTPREKGEHLVSVFRNGQHIPNSPFKVMVGESELGNASKVKVTGKGISEGMANEVNEFFVDTREAGYGNMSMSIEGPSKADIECHDMPDGTCRVTYNPTEPGTYVLNLKFADQPVPGSPFTVKVGGEPSAKITERITRERVAADVSHVGSECELSLKIPGTSPRDMQASVKSPSGVTEVCDVTSLDDSHYSVKFVPKEMGIHTVSVKHKDQHIPGSPFEFTVGPIAGGGSHKVHAAGPGLERGEVNQPCDFNIYTREAGAGGLSIAVEGPSKAEIDFQDRKDGSCGVTYNVTEPGEYYVSIKFNDEHIPDSPFRVPITPSIGDARKISVSALQEQGLQVGNTAAFVVDLNEAKGKGTLQARVQPPSGPLQEALIQEMDNGKFAIRFLPRENGLHLVHVLFDGYHIPGSPFRVMVGKVVSADAGKVTAYGDGLHTGTTGQISKFIVNTVNAGAGALAVTVEGPSKVKLECREVDEGYEFTYCPKAPGDYLITIRYAGVNIAGSPFKARVEGAGQPSGVQEHASVVVETVTKTSTTTKFTGLQQFVSDATKCVASGPGLNQGLCGQNNTFTVDTTGAGNNMMFVGMMGPEVPVDELIIRFVGNCKYSVTYNVKMKGRYILIVRWGEQDIPGSPFNVQVV